MDRPCFLKLLHITTEPWVFSSTSKAKFSLIQMNRNSSIKQNYLLEIFTSFIWRVLIKEKGTYILYIFQVLYFKKIGPGCQQESVILVFPHKTPNISNYMLLQITLKIDPNVYCILIREESLAQKNSKEKQFMIKNNADADAKSAQ